MVDRLINPYVERVLTAAEYDAAAMEAFMRVAWLVDPPPRLMRPAMIARALAPIAGACRQRRPAIV